MTYRELVEKFNRNLKHIKRELNSTERAELINKYKAEDDGHLAKILSLRGILLYN